MKEKVNIAKKFDLINQFWNPKILGEVNNSHVKIFKASGDFVWHSHKEDDEFFLVISGELRIKLRENSSEREIILNSGEFFIVPKGIEHKPYAKEEAYILLFEPKSVINTGELQSKKRVDNPEWI